MKGLVRQRNSGSSSRRLSSLGALWATSLATLVALVTSCQPPPVRLSTKQILSAFAPQDTFLPSPTGDWQFFLDATGSMRGFVNAGEASNYQKVMRRLPWLMNKMEGRQWFWKFGEDQHRLDNADLFVGAARSASTYVARNTDIASVLNRISDTLKTRPPPKAALIFTDGVQSLGQQSAAAFLQPIRTWFHSGYDFGIIMVPSRFSGPAFSQYSGREVGIGDYRGVRPFYIFILAADPTVFKVVLDDVKDALGSDSTLVKSIVLSKTSFEVRSLPFSGGCVSKNCGWRWKPRGDASRIAEFAQKPSASPGSIKVCFDFRPSGLVFDDPLDSGIEAILQSAITLRASAMKYSAAGTEDTTRAGGFESTQLQMDVVKSELRVATPTAGKASASRHKKRIARGGGARPAASAVSSQEPGETSLAAQGWRGLICPVQIGSLPDTGHYVVRAGLYLSLRDRLPLKQWVSQYSTVDDHELEDYDKTLYLELLVRSLLSALNEQPLRVFYLYLHRS